MARSVAGMAREQEREWGPERGFSRAAGGALRSLGEAREEWGRFIARDLW